MLQPLQLQEVLNRYQAEIAELRAFFHAARIPIGTPESLPAVATLVSTNRAFHRDLISNIWVVIDTRHHQISYADLLGILAIAAAGPQGAAAAPEEATHTILRFLMEARHSLTDPAATEETVAVPPNLVPPLGNTATSEWNTPAELPAAPMEPSAEEPRLRNRERTAGPRWITQISEGNESRLNAAQQATDISGRHVEGAIPLGSPTAEVWNSQAEPSADAKDPIYDPRDPRAPARALEREAAEPKPSGPQQPGPRLIPSPPIQAEPIINTPREPLLASQEPLLANREPLLAPHEPLLAPRESKPAPEAQLLKRPDATPITAPARAPEPKGVADTVVPSQPGFESRRLAPEEPIRRAPSKAFWIAVIATAAALALVLFYATHRSPAPAGQNANVPPSSPDGAAIGSGTGNSSAEGSRPQESYPATPQTSSQPAGTYRGGVQPARPSAGTGYSANPPLTQSYPAGRAPQQGAYPQGNNGQFYPQGNNGQFYPQGQPNQQGQPYAQGTSNPPAALTNQAPQRNATQNTASLPGYRPGQPVGGGIGNGAAAPTARPGAPIVRTSPNGAQDIYIRGAAKPNAPSAPGAIASSDLSSRVGARSMPTDTASYGIDSDGHKHPELKRRNPNGTLIASNTIPPNAVLRKGTVRASSEGIMSANLISAPAPAYPPAANAAGVQGEVRVKASIDRDGNVGSVRIISGPPLLRDAALDAVQRWRFRPLTAGGKPLPSSATAVVDFELQ